MTKYLFRRFWRWLTRRKRDEFGILDIPIRTLEMKPMPCGCLPMYWCGPDGVWVICDHGRREISTKVYEKPLTMFVESTAQGYDYYKMEYDVHDR